MTDYENIKYIPKAGSGYYVVQKGDSLWSIAKKYGISVSELKEINNLNSNLLNIGDVLKVEKESLPIKDDIYIVKVGDTLYSIAKNNNLTVNELKEINNLNSDILKVGTELIVKKPKSSDIYTVQKGDTLYAIANKYNMSVNNLKEMNNLNTNELSIGQKLIVPSKTNKTYAVQKGDTLYSISRKFNTTVSELQKINNLQTSNLAIGQELIISN